MSSDKPEVVVPSPRPIPRREIQLINRMDEMNLLREAADRAVRGEGGVVFLHGEAGIGKTRLARELGAYARSRGMQVLSGRCPALFRMDGVPPYVLWEEVIRDYLEVCTPEQLYRVIGPYPIEVTKLVPQLKQKLRIIPQSFPLSPERSRDRLFEAVSQFVTNISREAPLLVILDDLQWTDQSSLLLLHYLARGVYRESLLLLGAYRHTYVDKKHPLSPVLTELNRERLLQSVPLKRLTFDDASEMIRRILEQDDLPKEFRKLVYEKTRGNPFFIEEVIESLKEEEVIYREKNGWRIKEVSRIEFPETVKEVIKARIGRLDDQCQNALTLASFVGKDFTFEALLGVADVKEDRLVELCEKMLKTGLIKERVVHGEDVFSFADIIVKDVVYEEISRLKRKRLHGTVGRSLEKVYSQEIDEHLGELALHFLEGGDEEKALDYFLKAGERAAKVYANSEAASYFQSALKLLEEKESELQEKGRVLERLGDINKLVGDYAACTKYWTESLRLWKQLYERVKTSRLHRKLANVLWEEMSDTKNAKEHHRKALKILEREPENVERADLYEDMAHMYYRTGDMPKALSWGEKALELARRLNAYEVIASSYTSIGTILNYAGDRKKAFECLEKALKIALDNGYMETALRAYNNLASTLQAEEHERRMEYLEKGFELAKGIGHIAQQSWIGTNLAGNYAGMGDMEKAILLVKESIALDRKAGNMIHLSLSMNALGRVYQILGEWDKSEKIYEEALNISQRLNDFQAITSSLVTLGWFHFEKGEYDEAGEHFEKAYEVCEKAGDRDDQMEISGWIIWTCIELGEIKKAKNLLDNLHEFALETEDRRLIAWAYGLNGSLLRAQKRWKESIEHFENSLQEAEALDSRRWEIYRFAKLLYGYARVYLERDKEGDREEASNLLNQALEMFQGIGAKKEIERVRARMIHTETGREMISEPQPAAVEIALPERVTTGYGDLDDLLFGGIPRNYAVILTSPSCDERGLLVERFLEAGVKERGVTFYVTIDPGEVKTFAEESRSNFHLFICNPQADKIIKDLPNVFKLKGVENLTDLNIALTSAFRKLDPLPKRPRRICIAIISDVLLQHHAVQTRKWLSALTPEFRSNGFTTLAVLNPEMHSPQEVRAVLGLFEGEINIYEKETEKGLERFLRIKKMYNRKYSKRDLLLEEEKLQE